MNICVYDWALHAMGGGQKVSCKIAEHLSKNKGFHIDLLTLFKIDKKSLEEHYSVDFSKVNLIHLYPDSDRQKASIIHLTNFKRISAISKNYDLFFNTQGHETVKPLSKHSILLCHFPERAWYRNPKNFIDGLKLVLFFLYKKSLRNYASDYDKVLGNSIYSKSWNEKLWKIKAGFIYPPVEINKNKTVKKENYIMSAGRLTPDKNYEFMIECFKKLIDSGAKSYKYVIAGIIDSPEYLKKLEKISKGYPVEFKNNIYEKQLRKVYSKAKIFFHAKGYGIDENKTPQLAEHFGIATVEAMSYGCVPVTVRKGGQKEIVRENKEGFLYETSGQAIKAISLLIKNEKLRKKLAQKSMKRALYFSPDKFNAAIDKVVKEIFR